MAATSFVQGVQRGFLLNNLKTAEDKAHRGESAFVTALFQTMQERYTLSVVDHAMNSGGFSPLPRMLRKVIYLTPSLLAGMSKKIKNQAICSTVTFFQNHIGTLCHIATLISSIALIYFGQVTLGISTCSILGLGLLSRSQSLSREARQRIYTLFRVAALASSIALIYLGHPLLGIPSCLILGAGFLDQMGILPQKMRQWVHILTPPMTLAPSLFTRSFAERALCILFLVGYCMQQYLDRPKEPQEISIPSPHALNEGNLRVFLRDIRSLQVCRNYIHIPCSSSEDDLRMKFLNLLRECREQWMQDTLTSIEETFPFAATETIRSIGSIKLGLQREDTSYLSYDPFLDFASSYLGDMILETFWEDHTSRDLAIFFHEKIAADESLKKEVVKWWQDWVNQQGEEIQQQFKEGRLFNQTFERDGTIRDIFILPMLFQMGILEKSSSFGDVLLLIRSEDAVAALRRSPIDNPD